MKKTLSTTIALLTVINFTGCNASNIWNISLKNVTREVTRSGVNTQKQIRRFGRDISAEFRRFRRRILK